jgi:hypothetical protein
MAWLTAIGARVQIWALAVLGGLAALAGMWFVGKRAGKSEAAASGLQSAIDEVRMRDEEVSKLDALDDDAIRRRARERMREPNDK